MRIQVCWAQCKFEFKRIPVLFYFARKDFCIVYGLTSGTLSLRCSTPVGRIISRLFYFVRKDFCIVFSAGIHRAHVYRPFDVQAYGPPGGRQHFQTKVKRTYPDPIRTDTNPIRTRYDPYTDVYRSDTGPIRACTDQIRAQLGCVPTGYRPDTDPGGRFATRHAGARKLMRSAHMLVHVV